MSTNSDVHVHRIANSVARIVHASESPVTLGAIRDRIAYRDRASFLEAIAHAIHIGTICRRDRTTLIPGPQRPDGPARRGTVELADELDKLLGS